MKHLIKVALAAFVFSVVLSEPEPEPEDFDRGRRAADHFAEPEPEPESEDFNRGRRSAHDFESLGALDDLNILLTQCKRFESMHDDITEYLGKAKEMIAGSSQSADTVENHKIKLEAIKLFLQGLREAKSEDDLFGDTLDILESEATDGEEDDDSYLKGVASISDGLESLSEFDELNSLLPQCKRFESIHNEIFEYLAKAKEIIASSSESADTEDNRKIKLEAIQLFLQGVRLATSDDDLFEDALDIFESEVLDGEDEYDQSYSKDDASAIDDLGLSSHGEQAFSTYEALKGAESEKHIK